MKAFVHFVEVSSRWFAVAGMALLGIAVLAVMADIVLRRGAGISVPGTVDLVQLSVMTAFFLALPSTFLHEANVGVDFVTDRLPARALAALKGVEGLPELSILPSPSVAHYRNKMEFTVAPGPTGPAIGLHAAAPAVGQAGGRIGAGDVELGDGAVERDVSAAAIGFVPTGTYSGSPRPRRTSPASTSSRRTSPTARPRSTSRTRPCPCSTSTTPRRRRP